MIALGDELCARRPIRWRWPSGRELGRISVYAQGGDYHKTVKKALKALARWHRRGRRRPSSRCSSIPRR